MRWKGRLVQVFEFCRRLQAMDRLVRIEQVNLVNDDDLTGQVTMQMQTVIFYRPSQMQEQRRGAKPLPRHRDRI